MVSKQTTPKALKPRKRPSQNRSKAMVDRVLDAARELVQESTRADAPRLTTNLVAQRAGISVGSLYQYFPNIESVIHELYQQIMDRVIQVLDDYDSSCYLALPREEFFSQLNNAILGAEADPELTIAMHQAVKTYPSLQQIEQNHSERVAERMARFFAHYGSRWDHDKLKRLALYIYYINHGTWVFREHVMTSHEEATEWELGVIGHLLEQCFINDTGN